MFNNGTKRIIIIKDIPSNMIEEAILILKNDRIGSVEHDSVSAVESAGSSGTENASDSRSKAPVKKAKNNDFLVKEAEMIINNYIREHKFNKGVSRAKEEGKRKFYINLAINLGFAGSILLFLYLITRLV